MEDTLVLQIKNNLQSTINQLKEIPALTANVSAAFAYAKRIMEAPVKSSTTRATIEEIDALRALRAETKPMEAAWKRQESAARQYEKELRGVAKATNQYGTAAKNVAKANKDIASSGKEASLTNKQLQSTLLNTAAIMSTVYIAGRQLINQFKTGFDFSATVERSNIAFRVMTGSAQQAKDIMADLYSLQARSSMTLEGGAEGAKQLMAYGFEAKNVTKQLEMLAQVGGAVGVSIKDMAYVYGTLRSQGRAYTRDLMQFAMRGIPIYDYLAKTMGVAKSEIKGMTEAGKIGFPEVERAIQSMVGKGGVFFGLMEEQMDSLSGKVDLLGKSWKIGMGQMVDEAAPALKILFDSLREVITQNPEIFKELGRAIGDLVKTMTPIITSLLPAITKAITSILKIGDVLLKAFSPILHVIIGIVDALNGPLTTALVILVGMSVWDKLTSKIGAISESIYRLIKSLRSLGNAEAVAGLANTAQIGVKQAAGNLIRSGAVGSGVGGAASVIGSAAVLGPLAIAAGTVVASFGLLNEALRKTTDQLRADASKGGEDLKGALAYETLGGFTAGIESWFMKVLGTADGYLQSKVKSPLEFVKSQSTKLGVDPAEIVKALTEAGVVTQSFATELLLMAKDAEYAASKFAELRDKLIPDLIKGLIPGASTQKQTDFDYSILAGNIKTSTTKTSNSFILLTDIFGIGADRLAKALGVAEDSVKRTANIWSTKIAGGTDARKITDTIVKLISGRYTGSKPMATEGGFTVSYDKQLQEMIAAQKQLVVGGDTEGAKVMAKEIESLKSVIYAELQAMMDGLQSYTAATGDTSSNLMAQIAALMGKFSPDGSGGAGGAGGKDLGTWWTPIELAAQRTATTIDDLELAYMKSAESLYKEYQERKNEIGATNRYNQALADLRLATDQQVAAARRSVAQSKERSYASLGGASNLELGLLDLQNAMEDIGRQRQDLLDSNLGGVGDSDVANKLEADLLGLSEKAKALNIEFGKLVIDTLKNGDLSKIFEELANAAANAQQSGDTGGVQAAAIGTGALDAVQGTDIGSLIGGADPLVLFMNKLIQAVASLDSVQAILNLFTTIIQEAFETIGPMIDGIFKPFAGILRDMGNILAGLLAPIMNLIHLALIPLVMILKVLVMPVLQALGNAFAWFNDNIIVPVGNAFIDVMNAIITGINDIFGWAGVHLELLDRLLTTAEAKDKQAQVDYQLQLFGDTIEYLNDKLQKEINKIVGSAKALYEVGAISATEYEKRVIEAQGFGSDNQKQIMDAAYQAESLTQMRAMITALEGVKKQVEDSDTPVNLSNLEGDLVKLNVALEGVPDTLAGLDESMDIIKGLNFTEISSDIQDAMVSGLQSITDAIIRGFEEVAGSALDTTTGISTLPEGIDIPKTGDGGAVGVPTVPTGTPTGTAYWQGLSAEAKANFEAALQAAIAAGNTQQVTAMRAMRGFALGSANIPSDMFTTVHKGETIIPETFADSIRRGDLALSGGNSTQSRGGDTYITVNVQGSVMAENDLAETLAKKISLQRQRGSLTR